MTVHGDASTILATIPDPADTVPSLANWSMTGPASHAAAGHHHRVQLGTHAPGLSLADAQKLADAILLVAAAVDAL